MPDLMRAIRRLSRLLTCRLTIIGVLCGGLGLPGVARAENPELAREHYMRGTSYYDLGKYQEAIREFEAAYESKNDPAFLYNLAQSHRLAGNPEQALHFYRTYLKRAPNIPNHTEIDERIKKLEKLVEQKAAAQNTPPNQTIAPASGPPPAPAPVAAEPAPGSNVPPGSPPPAMNPSPMTPPPGVTPPPPINTLPPPATESGMSGARIAALILGGTGVVAIVTGALFGKAAQSAASEINAAGAAGKMFTPALEAVDKRGRRDQTLEFVFLTVGGLSLAGGVLCLITDSHSETASPGRVSVAPAITPHGASATMLVTF
jgi:tetratricopeptide (TPR) repeat protein